MEPPWKRRCRGVAVAASNDADVLHMTHSWIDVRSIDECNCYAPTDRIAARGTPLTCRDTSRPTEPPWKRRCRGVAVAPINRGWLALWRQLLRPYGSHRIRHGAPPLHPMPRRMAPKNAPWHPSKHNANAKTRPWILDHVVPILPQHRLARYRREDDNFVNNARRRPLCYNRARAELIWGSYAAQRR